MPMDRPDSRGARSLPGMSNREKPPFHLCFSRDQQLGKSDLCFSRADGESAAQKSYSSELQWARDVEGGDMTDSEKAERRMPTEDQSWPLVSSRVYGWWYKEGIHPRDSQFDFHKHTSDFVDFQMRIYAEDRRLNGY